MVRDASQTDGRSFEELLRSGEAHGVINSAYPNDEEEGIEGIFTSLAPGRTAELLKRGLRQVSPAYRPQLQWVSRDRAIQLSRQYLADVSSVDKARGGSDVDLHASQGDRASLTAIQTDRAVLIDVLETNRPIIKDIKPKEPAMPGKNEDMSYDMSAVNDMLDRYADMVKDMKDMYRDMGGSKSYDTKDMKFGDRSIQGMDMKDIKDMLKDMKDMYRDMKGPLIWPKTRRMLLALPRRNLLPLLPRLIA